MCKFPEIRRLAAEDVESLHAMLRALDDAGEAKWFKPHSFDIEDLRSLCRSSVQDLFYVLSIDGDVLAYGLLRGWDEGYETPSLGLAVHPSRRGSGLGKTMMQFLHSAALLRGSTSVRLRVSRSNEVAAALYRGMGYRFDTPETASSADPLLTGFKDLP